MDITERYRNAEKLLTPYTRESVLNGAPNVQWVGDKVFKIHKTALAGECNAKPGEVIKSGGKLVVACGESDSVEIIQLQAPGKKAMNAADFLRGNPIKTGEFFN